MNNQPRNHSLNIQTAPASHASRQPLPLRRQPTTSRPGPGKRQAGAEQQGGERGKRRRHAADSVHADVHPGHAAEKTAQPHSQPSQAARRAESAARHNASSNASVISGSGTGKTARNRRRSARRAATRQLRHVGLPQLSIRSWRAADRPAGCAPGGCRRAAPGCASRRSAASRRAWAGGRDGGSPGRRECRIPRRKTACRKRR